MAGSVPGRRGMLQVRARLHVTCAGVVGFYNIKAKRLMSLTRSAVSARIQSHNPLVGAKMNRATQVLITAAFVMALVPVASAKNCGPPARAKRHRWTGGESFPPLPLPATPLRRSEKKRPPAAPALIGKVRYGKSVWKVDQNGRKYKGFDTNSWTTPASDAKNLLRFAGRALGVRYRAVETSFTSFSYDPAELPILYLTGEEAFALSEPVRTKLRAYLQAGGMLICNAGAGSQAYIDAWTKEIEEKIFKKENRKVRRLPPDHPVFTSVYTIKNVSLNIAGKGRSIGPLELYGVNIGSRTAVIFSPYNLACAWDGHTHDYGKHIWPVKDAMKVGTNIVAYALATYPLGRFQARRPVYYESGNEAAERFSFGQIVHGGDWDPTPAGPLNLLRYVKKNSTLPVQFKRVNVDLRTSETFDHAFLYMTGLHDFKFTKAEVQNLRRYLMGGGVLLAEAALGRKEFDKAFRREIARAVPGARLQTIPSAHPIYASGPGGLIKEVRFTERLAQREPDRKAPRLEGLQIGGALAVIYSKDDLSSGWQQVSCPYALGYASEDALKLGHSILIYAMTH